MQRVSYRGWEDCARFESGQAEIIATLEVGPRIVRLGIKDGPNEFHKFPETLGQKGGDEFKPYGGHRLWAAPEVEEVTYEPDNEAVELFDDPHGQGMRTTGTKLGLTREMVVAPRGDEGCFVIRHRIRNTGEQTRKIAPWALTVMETGGECIFPQADYQPHPDALLPVRPMALWAYTDMADPRFTWGTKLVRLRQRYIERPLKVGLGLSQGWAAYANHGNLFVKRFAYDKQAEYPDFGCNFETFTREDMLEIETLGALQEVAPGEAVEHAETWYLVQDVKLDSEDAKCAAQLKEIVDRCPMVEA
jgi:hypothetical protein